ncbi:hypothetical protein C8A05DRAFT_38625 [Staphylotrichum tortipilum]|uniref:F-box domain-containing protein n=1 Tax=Staphylotrichum tortipilum TaxID=2831512 RepID=A0AAN6RP39_9PEZI|nr:hypothetical protein C8A05DRAFT_38625 [Staphylotrichum longicolle]
MASTTTSPQPATAPLDTSTLLSLTSYSRLSHPLPSVTIHPSQHETIRPSLLHTLGQSQTYALGNLSRLPFEIVSMIALELDVSSAFRLSHVNRTARELLSSVREFRHLRKHAVEAMCVLLRTGAAGYVSVSALYNTLTTRDCGLCGAFGGFLFLPNATRCCLTCVASAPETRVGYLSRVADASGITTRELKKSRRMPLVNTLPDSRRCLVAAEHAVEVIKASGVEEEEAKAAVARWPDSLTLRFQAATSLPYLDRWSGEAEAGLSCKGCQLAFEGDFSDHHLELRDRFYSREGFVEHVGECSAAGKLLAARQEGKGEVKEPTWTGLGRAFTAPCGQRRRSFVEEDHEE